MASRNFVDSRGVEWRAWSTVPEGSTVLSSDYAQGWLTFESADALRRLVPIPPGWDAVPDERLELFCRLAAEVPRHTGPFARLRRDEPVSADEGAEARR